VLAAAGARSGRPAKAVHWEGDDGAGWEQLRPDGSYRRVRAGMQLVDRQGPVSEPDLKAFHARIAQAASAVRAQPAPAALDQALRAAASLDRFCGEVDIQIAVHLISAGQAFQGTSVRALAEAAGLSLEPDGRFRLRDGPGRELFSLANEAAAPFEAAAMGTLQTTALLVQLDVPRAPVAAFARFRDFALQAAASLGGTLVDDNRSVLKEASFEAIAAQLQPVYESMEAQGLAAGSPLALRLFS
jgi:FtsZ-interacting cell division protein ZipA